jgi:hypothetical protein
MKKLKFREPHKHYSDFSDIDRIVKIFADRGYDISHSDASLAWQLYSDSMAAGWMNLGDDDDTFNYVFHYFEEVE